MNVSDLDFDYLRPPRIVLDIIHPGDYILKTEGKKYIRRIFYNVHYTNYEVEKLEEFQNLINKENIQLPHDWSEVDTMKYAYSGRFEMKKALSNLKVHLAWRRNVADHVLSENSMNMLKEGIMLISGRDKQYRPIITINVDRIKNINGKTVDDFLMALSYLLSVAQEFYFVPGKVENWIIMIDAAEFGFLNFPFKILKKIIDITSVNFTGTLEKLYIINPSKFLISAWNVIYNFIDPKTSYKVSLLKRSQFSELLLRISANQLEEKYGGSLVLPTVCWPPTNTLNKALYIMGKRSLEENAGSHNLDHTDAETKNLTNDDLVSSDVEGRRGSRNRERIRSSTDWTSGRNRKNSNNRPDSSFNGKGEKEVLDHDYHEWNQKSSRNGDRTGRFGNHLSTSKMSAKNSDSRYEPSNEDEEDEEDSEILSTDSKQPHVVRYQSLRNLANRLSTVKEDTFEEGMTSLLMFQDHKEVMNQSKSMKQRPSNQGLVSLGLLRNKTEMMEKGITEKSPSNSRIKQFLSGSYVDGNDVDSLKIRPEIVLEDKSELVDSDEKIASVLENHQLKMENGTVDSFCCKWEDPDATGKSFNQSQSCNIF